MYSTGVIKDMDDATNPIWDDKYLCSVHQMGIMCEAEIEEYGLRVNNIDYIDAEMYDMRVKVGLSINEMVDLRERKFDLRVMNWEDAVKIYNAVHTYLNFCANLIDHSSDLIMVERPMDDFKMLDEFADELYESVSTEIVEKRSALSEAFATGGLLTNRQMVVKNPEPDKRVRFVTYFEERFNNVRY